MKNTETTTKPESKRRILLVEDDSAVRESLAQALVMEDFWVVSAGSSREALRRFADQDVDLAILDLNLGDNDSGWVLFKSLNELAKSPGKLPIFVMSAQADALEHDLAD